MSTNATTEQPLSASAADASTIALAIAELARHASVELNVQDVRYLAASRELLPRGTRLYVSHLPKQSWDDTLSACRAVAEAGFDPIPHVPVRLLESEAALDRFLGRAVGDAQVREVLLISGDYPQPFGPFSTVADVLRSGILARHDLRRVSLAGHPEGHPKVALETIRRAEVEKADLAKAAGIEATFVTQFFFEAQPFVEWAGTLRAAAGEARIVAGLSGPAGIATLFKFAMRCGVGPSIRALGARPSSFAKLIGDYRPDQVLHDLAAAVTLDPCAFDGVHFFCFGGYLRTCEWLKELRQKAEG
jgi:methylenetetrahydrofolate reductase (NADPH)